MSNVITKDKRFAPREVIIKSTHRGLWFDDGMLVRTLEAGRHLTPGTAQLFGRRPRIEIALIHVRARADHQESGDPDLGQGRRRDGSLNARMRDQHGVQSAGLECSPHSGEAAGPTTA